MSHKLSAFPPFEGGIQRGIHVICGPTSSGKTQFALNQIGDSQAILITVDSRHLYQGLPTTSGWDLDETKKNIQYFGFGHFLPDQKANAVDYAKFVREVIDKNYAKKEIYLVGGSGFYLDAILHPEKFAETKADPQFRQELESLSLISLKERLQKVAPEFFNSLNHSDQNNPRRLIRRLEILSQPFPLTKGEPKGVFPYPHQTIYLPVPTNHQELIKQRIKKRLETGSLDEVKKLLNNYPDKTLPIYSAIGVKQMIMYIDGQISKDQMISLWLTDELNYVKRQLTWFKKQPDIIWYDGSNAGDQQKDIH